MIGLGLLFVVSLFASASSGYDIWRSLLSTRYLLRGERPKT